VIIMRRRLGVVVALGGLLGILGGVVTASPALARGPQWTFLDAQPFTLDPSFCGFPVGVAFPTDEEYAKLLKTTDGSAIVLVNGALTTSFTNLATGKTITENNSGPDQTTIFPDGSITFTISGNAVTILTPADAARFGFPTVAVTAGPLTGSIAPDGTFTSLSLHGHVLENVCAALS
jgi:hypothetical protein